MFRFAQHGNVRPKTATKAPSQAFGAFLMPETEGQSMIRKLLRLLDVPDYIDLIDLRTRRLERKMSRLTESTEAVAAFVGGIKNEVAALRERNAQLEAENAAAIADDAQDTATIEALLAEQNAVADRLESLLADAGENEEPTEEPEAPAEPETPAEEPTA